MRYVMQRLKYTAVLQRPDGLCMLKTELQDGVIET